ncbi:MAG: HYR domain-containing protein, partial [Bacteroidota bacterium]
PVTYTVTDDGGNSASCTFNVTVLDTQAPTVNCPAPITVTTPVGSCTAIVNYTVTASDNCPGAVAQLVSGPASGSAFPIGTTTVTWRAVDAAGNISLSNCSFTVTVLDGQLPVISAQPANRTVCVGTSATFSVTSSNALTYQWQAWNSVTQTWSDIPGATNSTYTVNNVTHSMNTNSYRVRIAGLCTTILSNHATLTVNPLPTISISTSIQPTLLPTQTVILTANGVPGGGTYVWFKNNVVIPGATSQTLGPLGIADLGTYKVTYTDPNGCVNTSADVVVKAQPSSGIVVYPNPNNGQFNVRFYNTTSQFATVHVYNAVGQRMLLFSERFTLTAQSYNTLSVVMRQFVAAGTYEVVVLDDNNRRIDVDRIIVANQ